MEYMIGIVCIPNDFFDGGKFGNFPMENIWYFLLPQTNQILNAGLGSVKLEAG